MLSDGRNSASINYTPIHTLYKPYTNPIHHTPEIHMHPYTFTHSLSTPLLLCTLCTLYSIFGTSFKSSVGQGYNLFHIENLEGNIEEKGNIGSTWDVSELKYGDHTHNTELIEHKSYKLVYVAMGTLITATILVYNT